MVQVSPHDDTSRAEKEVIESLCASVPLILIASIVPLIALSGAFIPEAEEPETWFQRSGSLSVLFAVWTEYNLNKVHKYIILSGVVVSRQTELSKKYRRRYRAAQYTGFLMAIVGTGIWGYGDLLHEAIM